MDMRSKILAVIVAVLLVASVWFSYLRFFVTRDFVVEGESECDPETERCFVGVCDPESTSGNEACTGNQDEDEWYYKIVRRNASSVPECEPTRADEGCPELSCEAGDPECETVYCDESTSVEREAPCSVVTEAGPVGEEETEEDDRVADGAEADASEGGDQGFDSGNGPECTDGSGCTAE